MTRRTSGREDEAVEAARRRLGAIYPDIAAVFWYGATDIHPRHLVVWVLLAGSADGIPQWAFPPSNREWHVDEGWTSQQRELIPRLFEMADVVRSCFRAIDWPDAEDVRVGFDSLERTKAAGWDYFK